MKKIFPILQFLKYLFHSKNRHGVHSPFVYFLNDIVFPDQSFYADFEKIEILRKVLLQDKKSLQIKELGAGSKMNNQNTRLVKDITKNTSKSPKIGRLLYKLVDHFQPNYILELGTSMGISTAYLASAKKNAKLYTLEGVPSIIEQAKKNLSALNLNSIEFVEGNFDDTLSILFDSIPSLDFAFIDGNHRYSPTLQYFELCLHKTHEKSVLIFDDIHWSKEMNDAWEEIKKNPKVKITIDLYDIGLVFFNDIPFKQNFVIRYDKQFF